MLDYTNKEYVDMYFKYDRAYYNRRLAPGPLSEKYIAIVGDSDIKQTKSNQEGIQCPTKEFGRDDVRRHMAPGRDTTFHFYTDYERKAPEKKIRDKGICYYNKTPGVAFTVFFLASLNGDGYRYKLKEVLSSESELLNEGSLFWCHILSAKDAVGNPFLKDLTIFTLKLYSLPISNATVESDEAHFWLNGYVNKKNCRIWSEANPQVYVETPLHPEKLTVWCALWTGGILLQKR
ncbi:hypothetical protein TNCV_3070121 [Trichonephila clavipes]|nr:hypothetical protein TNCV_3070121 [Trichonephila clavipes]